jgi:hypothetical protein
MSNRSLLRLSDGRFGDLQLLQQAGKLPYLGCIPIGYETGEAIESDPSEPRKLISAQFGKRDQARPPVAIVSHHHHISGLF